MSGPEASHDARWDCAALNIVNQIWQIPADWPETRRKAMDPKGIRADDLGRAARIASAGLTHDYPGGET